ncbi:MAG: hypothetical protein Ct9H300mP16_11740 [Pseudomonadota bacterium]|nr:MAG: hypothetical protein Ct9H300mP16_11740 [Pseudomonadota bacterium]
MARIVPPLEADHDTGIFRQQIDDLSFAFVSPLNTPNDDISPILNSSGRPNSRNQDSDLIRTRIVRSGELSTARYRAMPGLQAYISLPRRAVVHHRCYSVVRPAFDIGRDWQKDNPFENQNQGQCSKQLLPVHPEPGQSNCMGLACLKYWKNSEFGSITRRLSALSKVAR